MKEKQPDKTGEVNQETTISMTAFHLIDLDLPATKPQPIKAPMIEWVVDTGMFHTVARINQMAAANKAHMLVTIKISGALTKDSGSIIPLATVSVTWEPIKKAPENSITAAMIKA